LKRSDKVAADHDFLLDDRLAAEHDVLGANERGFPGHFVARVLCGCRVQHSRNCRATDSVLTVSMYSPLGGLLDILAMFVMSGSGLIYFGF